MFSKDSATLEATDRLNGRGLTIGIVQARFNQGVTEALAQACRDELLRLGVADKNIHLVQVPGALEVPVALLAMAAKLKYDALVALGCIIRGKPTILSWSPMNQAQGSVGWHWTTSCRLPMPS